MKKYLIYFLSFLIFAGVVSGASLASAAEVQVSANSGSVVGVGQEMSFTVKISTTNQEINAVEGTLHFSPVSFDLVDVQDGHSVVSLWPERPTKNQPVAGAIHFAGVMPGGYNGEKAELFSVVLKAKKTGNTSVSLTDLNVLLNDGQGTQVKTSAKSSQIQVIAGAVASLNKKTLAINLSADKGLPEPFTPVVSRDPNLFEGQAFLVFATQDKASGIDHYEVCEGVEICVQAESPFVLQHGNQKEEVIVKAFDKNNNIRIAMVSVTIPWPWYYYAILLVLLVVVGWLVKKYARRK